MMLCVNLFVFELAAEQMYFNQRNAHILAFLNGLENVSDVFICIHETQQKNIHI